MPELLPLFFTVSVHYDNYNDNGPYVNKQINSWSPWM